MEKFVVFVEDSDSIVWSKIIEASNKATAKLILSSEIAKHFENRNLGETIVNIWARTEKEDSRFFEN